MVGNLSHIFSIKFSPKDDANLSKGILSLSSNRRMHPRAYGFLPPHMFLLNHDLIATINNIPINAASGSICHISPLLRFYFWRSVYFNSDDSKFPSNSTEESGRFVVISKNIWHDMTVAVLKIKDNKVISRNKIMLTGEPSLPNIRTDYLTAPEVVKSRHVKTMM